jgi:hypothetical protein
LNLRRAAKTLFQGRDFLKKNIGAIDMPKAARVSVPIPASSVSSETSKSEKSVGHPLVSIALFCGIGLLVSLVAMLWGVQGAWY